MITPPVPENVINDISADITKVETEVAVAQKWAKEPLVAAVVHVAVLLGSALYLKLPAKDVAVLGSVYSAASAYFVTAITYVRANAPKK